MVEYCCFKILQENNYFPCIDFFRQKIPIQISFGQNIFNCQPFFFFFFAAHLRTN